jgi:hypothetical protein
MEKQLYFMSRDAIRVNSNNAPVVVVVDRASMSGSRVRGHGCVVSPLFSGLSLPRNSAIGHPATLVCRRHGGHIMVDSNNNNNNNNNFSGQGKHHLAIHIG